MTPEVDALETVAKINDKLISTNALLRDENNRWKESHKALRAENAKLRAALRNIADPNTDYEAGIEIARASLQKDEGE